MAAEGGFNFFSKPTIALPHHFAHASCAFNLSPFEEAAIFVADGAGGPAELIAENCEGPEAIDIAEGRTVIQNIDPRIAEENSEYESFYGFRAGQWHTLRKTIGRSNGIGAVYSRASRLLFDYGLDSGKTMGLSSYATPGTEAMFLAKSGPPDSPYFHGDQGTKLQELETRIKEIMEEQPHTSKYEATELQYYAACLQLETEEALIDYTRWLRTTTGLKNLCLCGGVALNCVANSRIWDEAGFEHVFFVPPCPGDDGIALGCALYGAALQKELTNKKVPVFGGCNYQHDPAEIEALGLRRSFSGEDVYAAIAREIANGAVVAWFQEGSEFGPSALGHRSFLADPRRHDMKDHLNLTVKKRENFRPFAPVILEENVHEYFNQSHPSYCMFFVSGVREEKQALLPAITHVDGTARFQVLRKEHNPQLYALISAFAWKPGYMLCSTHPST